MMDDDTTAYDAVVAAFKLPKNHRRGEVARAPSVFRKALRGATAGAAPT
jgi:formiminotetrahydrofolate cyclodeaminase